MRYYDRHFGLNKITNSPPDAADPMDLETAKAHLRVDHSTEDEIIRSLIRTAGEYFESKGVALITQQWEMTLDEMPNPDEYIKLPIYPVQAVNSLAYVDTGGTTQTWSTSDYQVSMPNNGLTRIMPGYSLPWPTARSTTFDALTITFTAGFGDEPSDIPERVSSAMKLLIGHLYINREAVVVIQGIVSLDLPIGFQALLDNVTIKEFR